MKDLPFYLKGAHVGRNRARRKILTAIWVAKRLYRIDRKDRGPIKLRLADFLRLVKLDRKTLDADVHSKNRIRIERLILQAATSTLPSLPPARTPAKNRAGPRRTSVFKHNGDLASALTVARNKIADLEAQLKKVTDDRDALAALVEGKKFTAA